MNPAKLSRLLPDFGLFLCLTLIGCSAQVAAIRPLTGDLSPERVFSVVEATWNAAHVEQVLSPALESCGYVAGPPEAADLKISWEEKGGQICLDYWGPECDAQEAVAFIAAGGRTVEWRRTRPGWCNEADCLLTLLARDLRRGLCGDRDSPAEVG